MTHNKIYNIGRPLKKAAGYSSSSITDEAYTLLWAEIEIADCGCHKIWHNTWAAVWDSKIR